MLSFILMLQLTTKLMNIFSYYITTHFITRNKDYNSCCNLHLVYQTYPKCMRSQTSLDLTEDSHTQHKEQQSL